MDKKTILILAHNDYTHSIGGVEKFITEQTDMFERNGFEVIGICPVTKQFSINERALKSSFCGYMAIKKKSIIRSCCSFDDLIVLLKAENICKLVIHSIIKIPYKDVLRLIDAYTEVDTYFYIHDFKSICVCQVLMKNKRNYCGSDGRSLKKCHFCRFYWEGFFENRFYSHLIADYNHIVYVFPAEITKENWQKCYTNVEEKRLLVIPHQVLSGEPLTHKLSSKKLRIAYVGYKSFNKGWSAFKKLVSHDKGKHEFYVLGRTNEMLPDVKCVSVSFHEDGPDAMIKAIRNNNIDVALLWSMCPETYSYTLYESFVGGAFIITNPDSGNIQAQVKKLQCGKILNSIEDLIRYVERGELDRDVEQNIKPRPSGLLFNEKGTKRLIV